MDHLQTEDEATIFSILGTLFSERSDEEANTMLSERPNEEAITMCFERANEEAITMVSERSDEEACTFVTMKSLKAMFAKSSSIKSSASTRSYVCNRSTSISEEAAASR